MINYGLPDANGAEIPPTDSRYRYLLWRIWADTLPPLGFVMLNPSTADHEVNDNTIRRCIGFAQREACGGIIVANLYGLRSKSPKLLAAAEDPVGPLNDPYIRMVGTLCPTVVCAWGEHAKTVRQTLIKEMLKALRPAPKVAHLGLTKGGRPKHPLYIKKDQPLVEWA